MGKGCFKLASRRKKTSTIPLLRSCDVNRSCKVATYRQTRYVKPPKPFTLITLPENKSCQKPRRIKFTTLRIPICNDRIRPQLAGLTNSLNFQLLRKKKCPVIIEFDAAGEEELVTGVICSVGTNFIDIRKRDDSVVTLMPDRITRIKWIDPRCNPCER